MKAFCLKAPTVRFVNLAIVFAGVFSCEWFFNSRKSSFVHSRPRTLILPPPEPETLAVFRIKRAIHAPRVYLRLLRPRDERPRPNLIEAAAGERSAIDLPEHDVERADDRRDVGQHVPAAQ